MSNNNPRTVREVLKEIESKFHSEFHEKLKKSNNSIVTSDTQAATHAQNQAKAKTLVYLCLALNPYREDMVPPNSNLLESLGLTPKSVNEKNLKPLAKTLKNNPESKTKREILHYMANVLMIENWKAEKPEDEASITRDRSYNKAVKDILKETYAMDDLAIKLLANVCMNGAANLEFKFTNIPTQEPIKGSKVNVPLLVLGLGVVGGYVGGNALITSLVGAGVIAASATISGAIIIGAILAAVGTMAALAYGIYKLCGLIQDTNLVKNWKGQYNYFKHEGHVRVRYSQAVSGLARYANTIEVFIADPRPSGELPNLVK